jgi:hypothetical protein
LQASTELLAMDGWGVDANRENGAFPVIGFERNSLHGRCIGCIGCIKAV